LRGCAFLRAVQSGEAGGIILKVKINYRYDFGIDPPCYAYSVVNGEKLYSSAESWKAVRAKHIKMLQKLKAGPPPEEVEIESLGEFIW
jgi:hypothetical protein